MMRSLLTLPTPSRPVPHFLVLSLSRQPPCIYPDLFQTRGWFYTLTVLGAALFDKPAFKNLIVNGLVLASDGKKMSKRLKNYPGENF